MKQNIKKTAAIITAEGLGDGLIMLIAANFLHEQGYIVTVFNKQMTSLSSLLPSFTLSPYPDCINDYNKYDLLILQHDNSNRAKNITELKSKNSDNLHIFYPSYNPSKHEKIRETDIAFDNTISMVENVYKACKKMLISIICNKDIGLRLPNNVTHKKHQKRVIIHPVSGDINKNWPKSKFIQLSKKLSKLGYDPVFILSDMEKIEFKNEDIKIYSFSHLSDLCCFIYESAYFIGNDSGPGHLASYLQIPSTIIANNKKRMHLWQPGWGKAKIITPSSLIPNPKIMRLREKKWDFFITTNSVIKSFLSHN